MKGRYVVSITPDDVGSRVTVRARIPAPAGGPSTTDTVGRLRAWEHGVLHVERRDGTTVAIAEDDVVAARAIPPRADSADR